MTGRMPVTERSYIARSSFAMDRPDCGPDHSRQDEEQGRQGVRSVQSAVLRCRPAIG